MWARIANPRDRDFFKTSKKLSKKLDRLEEIANKDVKKAQKFIDKGSKKAKYGDRIRSAEKKIEGIKKTRELLDVPGAAASEGGSNLEIRDKVIRKKID